MSILEFFLCKCFKYLIIFLIFFFLVGDFFYGVYKIFFKFFYDFLRVVYKILKLLIYVLYWCIFIDKV